MAIEKLNIPGLPEPQGFVHVAIATGSRQIFLAGLVAQDGDGNTVGVGDLAAQMEQALLNVAAGLQAASATFADIVKTTLYVVDWDPSKMEQLMDGFMRAAAKIEGVGPVPSTLIPVPVLSQPDHLIELDVTAIAE